MYDSLIGAFSATRADPGSARRDTARTRFAQAAYGGLRKSERRRLRRMACFCDALTLALDDHGGHYDTGGRAH